MGQQVKVLAANHDQLSSIPETHMVDRTDSRSCPLHTWLTARRRLCLLWTEELHTQWTFNRTSQYPQGPGV